MKKSKWQRGHKQWCECNDCEGMTKTIKIEKENALDMRQQLKDATTGG